MKLVGCICRDETKCQLMVQNVPELRPKLTICIQIEDGEVCNKRRGAPRDGEGQCAGCDRL